MTLKRMTRAIFFAPPKRWANVVVPAPPRRAARARAQVVVAQPARVVARLRLPRPRCAVVVKRSTAGAGPFIKGQFIKSAL